MNPDSSSVATIHWAMLWPPQDFWFVAKHTHFIASPSFDFHLAGIKVIDSLIEVMSFVVTIVMSMLPAAPWSFSCYPTWTE